MTYQKILLTDQISIGILLMIYLGSFIPSFFIVKVLMKKTNKKGLIFWYLGVGIIYAFLLLLVTEGSSGFQEVLPPSFRKMFELVFVIVAFLGIWPIIIIMTFGGILLFGIFYAGFRMEDIWVIVFLQVIPQLASFLIIRIFNAKGFFQSKKDLNIYEEQNKREEKSTFQ